MIKSKNPNHPKKGSSIKSEPIRDPTDIARIKSNLIHKPRDHLLFVMGVNTAYRMNELLSLQIKHVLYGVPGHTIDLKQSKQGQYRAVTINRAVFEALVPWLHAHKAPKPSAPLFLSRKGRNAITVSYASRLVKGWCKDAGLVGAYSAHSLRKTWAFSQRVHFKESILLISRALGHSSVQETVAYLGLVPEEVHALYRNVV